MIFDVGDGGGGILVIGGDEKTQSLATNISTFSALTVESVNEVSGYEEIKSLVDEKKPKFIICGKPYAEYVLKYSQDNSIPAVYNPYGAEYDLAGGGLIVKFKVKDNMLSSFSINHDRICVVV